LARASRRFHACFKAINWLLHTENSLLIASREFGSNSLYLLSFLGECRLFLLENGAKSRFSSEFVANLEKQTGETGSHPTASATTQSVIFHISRD
jgi:hypothetical protein